MQCSPPPLAASVRDDLRRRRGSLSWQVRLGGTWLYVQLEFQSTVDPVTAVTRACSDPSGMCLRLHSRHTTTTHCKGRQWLPDSSQSPCGIPGAVQGEACTRPAHGGNRDDDG